MTRKKRLNQADHRALALWAADCAAHVLKLFERKHPRDDRPRKAIELCRAWARGKVAFSMKLVRAASLNAHAAARSTAESDTAARAAARAAGQAVATLHVPEHARGAAAYAVLAAHGPANLLDLIRKPAPGSSEERDRQLRRLPKRLWSAAFPQVVRKARRLVQPVHPRRSSVVFPTLLDICKSFPRRRESSLDPPLSRG